MDEKKNKRLAIVKAIELAFTIVSGAGFIAILYGWFILESEIVTLLGAVVFIGALILSYIVGHIEKLITRNIVKTAALEEYTHEKLDNLLDEFDQIREMLKDADFTPISGIPSFIGKYEYGRDYPENMKDHGLILIDELKQNIAIFTEAMGFNIIPVNNIINVDYHTKIIEREMAKEAIKAQIKADAPINVAGALIGAVTGHGFRKVAAKYNYINFYSVKVELKNPQEFSGILQNDRLNFFIPTSRILFANVLPHRNDEALENASRVSAFIKHYTVNSYSYDNSTV